MSERKLAFDRGCRDARRGLSPLFREVQGQLVADCDHGWDAELAAEWSQDDRSEYMRGYDSTEVSS